MLRVGQHARVWETEVRRNIKKPLAMSDSGDSSDDDKGRRQNSVEIGETRFFKSIKLLKYSYPLQSKII